MTTKFEEIKSQILAKLVYLEDWCERVSSSDLELFTDLLNQLQLPKLTCSSCESYTPELDSSGSCKKGIGCDYFYSVDGITPIVFNDFGCIEHSDYEAQDE